MLDQELWKRLPAPLPSLADALAARSSSSDEVAAANRAGSGDCAAFEAFVVRGNPWRKQSSPQRHRHAAVAALGPGSGAAAASSGGRAAAAQQQEVDEYGVPRAGSGALSMPGSAAASRPGSAQSGPSVGPSRSGTEADELIELGQDSRGAFGAFGEAAGVGGVGW